MHLNINSDNKSYRIVRESNRVELKTEITLKTGSTRVAGANMMSWASFFSNKPLVKYLALC